MSKISFTIITAVLNGSEYIEKCITSIINNGYDLNSIEHIIVDDGSTDNTKEICKQYAQKYKHIKFYSKPNGNWGSVINYVKHNKLAHGDYIYICDSDDYILPNSFSYINDHIYLKNGNLPDVYLTGFKRWNGKKSFTTVRPYYLFFKRELFKRRKNQFNNALMVPQSTYTKKEFFYKVDDLLENVAFQDTILYSKLYNLINTIKYTTRPCSVYWYKRPGNTMSSIKDEKNIKIWVKNLEEFSKNDNLENFFYVTLGIRNLYKYVKKNNIKFNFTKRKLDVSAFPWFVRWILHLLFLTQTKKLINWVEPSNQLSVKKNTTISIITPIYNGANYISNCIQAIVNNGYDLNSIEHIIVDDGSTDNTKEICKQYAQKYKHIKFYSKPNGNWGSVINYVKHNKLAHGDYIYVCDADDQIVSGAFNTINKNIKKFEHEPDLYTGSFYLWDGKKKKQKVQSYYFKPTPLLFKKSKMEYFSPLILPFTTFIKNNIFYSVPDLKEHVSYQDNILYTSAYTKSTWIAHTSKPFGLYWQKRSGNTVNNITTEKGILNQLLNLKFYADNDLIEAFFYQIFPFKETRKYLIKHNIHFTFKNTKPKFNGFPWFIRWILHLMFISKTRKIIRKA